MNILYFQFSVVTIIVLFCCKSTLQYNPECQASEFECPSSGECISKGNVCDGHPDCSRGEDEASDLNCPPEVCFFKCVSQGICIGEKYLCDGLWDCRDGSDEENCEDKVTSSGIEMSDDCNEFRCSNEKCVSNFFVCDGEDDCGDWSDESSCECDTFDEVNCGRCIPESWLCDTIPDCPGGADEKDCGNGTKVYIPLPTFKNLLKQHYHIMDLKQRQKMTDSIYSSTTHPLTVAQIYQKAHLKRRVKRKLHNFLKGI